MELATLKKASFKFIELTEGPRPRGKLIVVEMTVLTRSSSFTAVFGK